jgi:hypothetical protein
MRFNPDSLALAAVLALATAPAPATGYVLQGMLGYVAPPR